MNLNINNMASLLPEIFLSVSLMFMLLFGVFNNENTPKKLGYMTITILVACFLLVISSSHKGLYFNDMLIVDDFSIFLKSVILIGVAVSLVLSLEWLEIKKFTRFEFPIIVLFSTIGMMLAVSAYNLIILYASIELLSLSLYLLAGYKRRAVRSTEAGIKYFLMGGFASGLFLFGLTLIYGFSGSININEIASFLNIQKVSYGLVTGMSMVGVSLLFKLGIVPFHSWVPDVYEGAPTPVSAFFASIPKIAIVGVFMRLINDVFTLSHVDFTFILSVFAVLSMFFGAVGAIFQKNIKRMIAYSAINHAGYILMGLAVKTQFSFSSVLFYMVVYAIMILGVFACILLMRISKDLSEDISSLKGLSKKHPFMAICFSILMFSMAGLPPTAGFVAKFYLFLSAIKQGYIALVVVAIITSVIACYYYLRIVKVIYFDKPDDEFDKAKPSVATVMGLSSFLVLAILLKPNGLFELTKTAIQALF